MSKFSDDLKSLNAKFKIHRAILSVLIIFGTIGGLGAGFWMLNKRGFFNLTQIEILVEEIPAQKGLLKSQVMVLQDEIETLRGKSLWKLPLRTVSSKFLNKPWIDTTEVSRRWPDTLRVKVIPAKIYLLYVTSKGLRPVLSDGSFLAPVRMNEAPDVPHLRGNEFEKDVELRKQAVDIVRMIPERGKFAISEISEIRFDTKEGFWISMMGSQIKVKMGIDSVSLKSARVNQVLTYLDQRGLNARVIDADLSQKVLVRLRKDP